VADFLGIALETVCRWWSAHADHGLRGFPPLAPDDRPVRVALCRTRKPSESSNCLRGKLQSS
jgi:hypothetical protein